MTDDRRELLERYGRAYGDAHLAVCFTETNNPAKGDVKKGRTGWPKTKPLPHAARGAALLTSQGQYRNPATVSRPSGLIVIENDVVEGLELIEELSLPRTVTVRSSEDWKRHYWFRSWNGEMPEHTSFRIEASGITAEDSRLFLCPPAIHPSGSLYTFVNSILDTEIAVIPEGAYADLVRRAGETESAEREQLQIDPEAKITTGRRRNAVFKFACMQRRWSSSEEEIAQIALIWNQTHCEPPLDEEQVRHQVKGAMSSKFEGGQELVRIQNEPAVARAATPGTASETAQPPTEPVQTFGWPEPLSGAVYHGVAGKVVRTIDPETQADPAAVLIQLLTSVGAACGRGAGFTVEGVRHCLNLFTLIAGDSATSRKGSSFAQAIAPVLCADMTFSHTTGLSTGEGLIWEIRDPVEKRRKARANEKERADEDGYIVELVDEGVADKRLLIVETEFASVLARMGREGNTLSPVIRQAWEGSVLKTMTKGTPATATGAHVAIVAHITAEELRTKLTETDVMNGFANRFLLVCASRSKSLPRGGKQIEWRGSDEVEQIRNAIRYAQTMSADVGFDDAAGELWDQEYERLETGRSGLLAVVTNRAAAQTRRLATLYAILDLSARIQLEHLRAALELWRYCEDSARHLFADSTGDPDADVILSSLRKHEQEGQTKTELSALFSRNLSAERLDRGLLTLHIARLARMEREETGGRPAERWYATGGQP